MLQCAAVCCSVLQCAVVCCSVLQCVAVCCSAWGTRTYCICSYCRQGCHCGSCSWRYFPCDSIVCCSVLQCVAVCCSVLQCVAVLEAQDLIASAPTATKAVQGDCAVCCSVLQCVAVCCSVLQCLRHRTLLPLLLLPALQKVFHAIVFPVMLFLAIVL